MSKNKKIKLRINPKNIETRVGTLACPEAFNPKIKAKKEFRKKLKSLLLGEDKSENRT